MKDKTTKYMLLSLLSNIFLTIIKIVFGLISKSKTLLADGIHCLSDMSTDIVGIVGAKISNKKPDKDHPFGHGKAEYITSIFISMFILALSIKIFTNSFTPNYRIDSYYILIVSLVSIIVKYILSGILIKKGKDINSNILITSGTESRFDVISSTLAFTFILLSLLSKDFPILKYADTIGSIVISLLTLRIGIKLFIENFKLSLGEVELSEKEIIQIKNILLEYNEIKTIRRVNILKYGSYKMIILDIEVGGNLSINKYYKIDKKVKDDLRLLNNQYKYININVRPLNKNNK